MLVILWEVSYQCWDGVCVCEGCSYASVRATHVYTYTETYYTSYCILGAIIPVHMMVNHLKSCTLLLVR